MKLSYALIATGASLILAPFFSATPVFAVTVVDSSSTEQIAQEQQQKAVNAANSELFHQVQMLQEEVMRTRGMIEELQFQVQELQKQRLEDYKNLDKRISELGQGPNASFSTPSNTTNNSNVTNNSGMSPAALPSANVTTPPVTGTSPPLVNTSPTDSREYQKAYELIKQRKFSEARDAFLAFLEKYPGSTYEPNAHYWLGELYIIEGNYLKAKSEFQVILKRYPAHSKYPEALYKIATVNYELGDRTTAKLQLQQLIEQYGNKPNNAVTKAREFLQTNYP